MHQVRNSEVENGFAELKQVLATLPGDGKSPKRRKRQVNFLQACALILFTRRFPEKRPPFEGLLSLQECDPPFEGLPSLQHFILLLKFRAVVNQI